MTRPPPTPPPTPPFPLFTLDGFYALFLRPLTNPLFLISPPLLVLSLSPDLSSPAFRYSCAFTVIALIFQALFYFDGRIADGTPRKLDWTKEVVLITGGAGGLGRVLAEYYGGIRRCSTIVVDVMPATEARLKEWEALGCGYYQCDVGSSDAVNELRDRIIRDVGKVSVLILAAGIVNSKSILDLSNNDVEKTINVNLLGAIWCIKAFLPDMLQSNRKGLKPQDSDSEENERAEGGTIVAISSVLGYLGAAGLADYTSTKAALSNFMTSLRAEISIMAASGSSRVNTILATPGQLSTPLFAHVPPPPLAGFVGPTVTPAALSSAVIRAVDDGVDKEIALPLYTQWVTILGLLPRGMAKMMRSMVGVDWAGWTGARNRLSGS